MTRKFKCRKCESEDVAISYQFQEPRAGQGPRSEKDHLYILCNRCSYSWNADCSDTIEEREAMEIKKGIIDYGC